MKNEIVFFAPYVRPASETVAFETGHAILEDSGEGGGGNSSTEPIHDPGTSHGWH